MRFERHSLAAEEHEKMNRSSVWIAPEDRWINETFSMVILTKKEVEKRIAKHPEELTEWLDANIENLVISLIEAS